VCDKGKKGNQNRTFFNIEKKTLTAECCHILGWWSNLENFTSGALDERWTSLATVEMSRDMSYALAPFPITTTTYEQSILKSM